MDTLEKAEPTTSIQHIVRFLKPGTLIHNSEVPSDTDGIVTRRRRRRRRQLQSVLRFTRTQKGTRKALKNDAFLNCIKWQNGRNQFDNIMNISRLKLKRIFKRDL